jgi:uncharacterized YigZ family protein
LSSPTSYQTIQSYAEETLLIKKSRFIGQAMPVESEAAALKFIENLQKKHWQANHNCYAYQIGAHNEIQKSSDNGEPAGTAGKPILEVIKKENLKNVVVVVTRYFGGILLGAGGLVRAYSQSTSAVLQTAGIVTRDLFQAIHVQIDYSWWGKVENETLGAGYFIDEVIYTDRVLVVVLVPSSAAENYIKLIANATNGQAMLSLQDQIYASTRDGKLIK